MSDYHPADFPQSNELPMSPMMRPLPGIDQAGGLPPQTLLDETRRQLKIAKAMLATMFGRHGYAIERLLSWQIDMGSANIDIRPTEDGGVVSYTPGNLGS